MKRKLITDAMKTRFTAISIGSGYYTTFAKVYGWIDRNLEPDEVPAVIVRDTKEAISFQTVAGPNDRHQHDLTVEISIVARGTEDQIRQMMADVYKSIGTDDTWSGNALTTEAESDEIIIDQEGFIILGALLTVKVTYITNRFAED